MTVTDSDLDTDLDLESKPNAYIVLCRTCSHCTDLNSDTYSLFLYRTGIPSPNPYQYPSPAMQLSHKK